MRLAYLPEAAARLAERGYDEKNGARPLRRTLTNLVEDPLADALLSGELEKGEEICVCLKEKEICLEKVPRPELTAVQ